MCDASLHRSKISPYEDIYHLNMLDNIFDNRNIHVIVQLNDRYNCWECNQRFEFLQDTGKECKNSFAHVEHCICANYIVE